MALVLIGPPATLVGKALSFTHELFYQPTVLGSHAVDGHQMYFGGSVVGILQQFIEISPTPPLIFTGGVKKCKIWRRVKHDSTLSRPRFTDPRDNLVLTTIVKMSDSMNVSDDECCTSCNDVLQLADVS